MNYEGQSHKIVSTGVEEKVESNRSFGLPAEHALPAHIHIIKHGALRPRKP